MNITVYGIPNCDTIRKARQWLDGRGIAYTFHDYKKEGADPAKLERWVREKGWEALLNRAGTTFRTLPDADKQHIDAAKAVTLMLDQPSMIKRPVVEHPGGVLIGFRESEWQAALA
jgi:Spx/MgsR family transcriptional regulator